MYVGGLWEAYICDALPSGFGVSVLTFFGDRDLFLLDIVVAPSGRVRGAWVPCG